MKVSKAFIIVCINIFSLGSIGMFVVYALSHEENPNQPIIGGLGNTVKNIFISSQKQSENDAKKYNQALYYLNDKPCHDISNEKHREECQDHVTITKVLKGVENIDCNRISHEGRRAECINISLEKTAISAENKYICSIITDNSIQERCKDSVNAKILERISKENSVTNTQCEQLDGNFYNECIKLIRSYKTEEAYITAIQDNNFSLCAELSETHLKIKCHDEIISEKASNTHNPLLCANIQNPEIKKDCIYKSTIKNNNILFQEALKHKNLSLCPQISDNSLKIRCNDIILLETIQKNKNTELCNYLQNPENVTICQKISQQ